MDWLLDRYPLHAEHWLEGLEECIQSLETFPRRCPLAPESSASAGKIRQMIYGRRRGRYRILYRISGRKVEIISVAHGARSN